MAEFTLLELHLDDATITANAPCSDETSAGSKRSILSRGGTEADESEAELADDGGRGNGTFLAFTALIGLLIVIGARALLGGDSDQD